MSKYEILDNSYPDAPAFLILDSESRKYFAGYDFMGSVNWTDDLYTATVNGLSVSRDEAEQIVEDLKAMEDNEKRLFTVTLEIEAWDEAQVFDSVKQIVLNKACLSFKIEKQ